MKTISKISVLVTAFFVLSGFQCSPKEKTGKASWEDVLAKCGLGDMQKSKTLYFGASNGNGVGSIWSLDSTTGDMWPTSQLSDVTSRRDIVFSNKEFGCSGEATSGMDFDVKAGAKPVVYPISGEVQAAFANASSVKVRVTSILQEDAYWDSFNQEFAKLPMDGQIRKGVELGNRMVMARAWKVRGFQATIQYSQDISSGVKANIDAKVASGNLGVSAKWKNANSLEISSTQDLYIAGVFRKLSPTGVSAAIVSSEFAELPINAHVQPAN
ncbi:hypothetical protein [Massilia suwonensis]|uniref:Uncharacterized protein n=1 Tax=Massilia suwonensis TaxID=648895 RepID=A0ABW0ML85_9BURK